MAKNAEESRIPVPRATRPSFFPKSRALGSSKIGTGYRHSPIFPHRLQFVDADDGSATPKAKCSPVAASTPLAEVNSGNKAFVISPVWDLDKNDMQQLVHYGEEKNRFFSLLEKNQLSRIEDVGDACLVDLSLGSLHEGTVAGPTPHYLMLNKQNSFEHDESLGILTPDQMTDFTVALECSRTPSCENLTGSTGSRLAHARPCASASASRPSADAEPTEEASSERTPSPEELPLDPKPVEPSRGAVPVSFVTSVTSITSLEAGYQGDGENSRPASRSADPPSVAPPPNLPAPCRQDPMTDSDFFTESDADAHEEIVRGDRKAQVIDGTLFCAPGGRRCPSFTGEEMDSSGIYSDLDKRQDERNAPEEEAQEESEDRTPDTVDTEVSQRSQSSSVKAKVTHMIMDYLQDPAKSLEASADSSASMKEITVIELERSSDSGRPKSANKTDSVPLKKYKMPKRNVVSKIKAMIESGPKDEAEKEAKRTQRSARKGGRWDAVMSKIEAGKNDQRTRPPRKEVKSRVLQTLTQSSAAAATLKTGGTANVNNNKDKRRIRGRQEMKSPTQETARSSVRSSMSDLSSAPSKDALKRFPTSGTLPRRIVTNGRTVQQARVNSFEAKKSCVEVAPVNLEKSPSATRKPTITRRSPATAPLKQQTTLAQTKDREAKENNTGYAAATRPVLETRDQAAQTEAPYEALRVRRAEKIVEALSVTVQYLAYELDAFSMPTLKRNCEKMKNEWLAATMQVEELRARHLDIEQRLKVEREDHRKALDQLREDQTRHVEEVTAFALQEERQKWDARLRETLNESAEEHRAAIARLRAEHENELARKDSETKKRLVVHNQGAALTAEVESLRSVLQLRSQENAMLRSELESFRRDVEEKESLQLRVDTLEARCEDLKAQLQCKEAFERQISHENEVLHESIHQVSKHNKRLSQRNEELQWRLRQKNEVVTVLANQLVTPRLSRSLGPESIEHASTNSEKNASQSSSSMVKFMVEKGDSVSWTLEIDEPSNGGGCELGTPPKVRRPESATSVSRQGSLRLSPRRPATNTRARSKSISVTDSARSDDSHLMPKANSTPIARRRPRSDPSSSASSSASSTTSSSAGATNPVVAVAVAAAAAAAAAAEDVGTGQVPQEAGGEAMISEEMSASSSEDESSTSSDIPRLQFAA